MGETSKDPGPQRPPPAAAGRVYVVDDDPSVQELLVLQVEHLWMAATAVAPSRPAVDEAIAKADASDVFVLDIILGPDLDGFEVVRMLGIAGFRGRLLAISGVGQDYLQPIGALATALGIRVAGTLAKPVGVADLARCLSPPGPGQPS